MGQNPATDGSMLNGIWPVHNQELDNPVLICIQI